MPIKTFYAKCRCQKYVACDSGWDYDLTRLAQAHANECGNQVIIGQCPPNICYSNRIFHYKTVYPKEDK